MPRPDVRDERIPEILAASCAEFSAHGIDGASMTKIAARCGCSKATIYHYFDSKEALITALVREVFAADLKTLSSQSEKESTAHGSIRGHATRLVEMLEEQPAVAQLLNEVYARASRMPEVSDVLRRSFSLYIEHFTSVFARGVASGELRQDLVPPRVALAWVASLEGALVIAAATSRPRREVVDEVVASMVALTSRPRS